MRLNDNRRSSMLVATVLPALATILVMIPVSPHWKQITEHLLWPSPLMLPLALAFGINALRPAATTFRRALLAALPQLVLVPGLLALSVWADVQRGYFEDGDRWLGMTILAIIIVGPVIGFAFMLVTAAFWRLGAFVGRRG